MRCHLIAGHETRNYILPLGGRSRTTIITEGEGIARKKRMRRKEKET
jgi:hypothetical protein